MKAILTILFGVLAGILSAHDLTTSVEISPRSVIVRTSYSGEESAAYAQVLVYGPGDRTREFQNGGTDANGVFSFVPDRDGEWLLVVDDGMGHRAEVKVQINRSGGASAATPTTNLSTGQKLLAGVSFILGFTGLLAWLRVRRLSAPGPRP